MFWWDTTAATTASAGHASATGAAYNATVYVGARASAEVAWATVWVAQGEGSSLTAVAGAVAIAGAAYAALPIVTAMAGGLLPPPPRRSAPCGHRQRRSCQATTGAAYAAVASLLVNAGHASATAAAHQPAPLVHAIAGQASAAATALAFDATVSTINATTAAGAPAPRQLPARAMASTEGLRGPRQRHGALGHAGAVGAGALRQVVGRGRIRHRCCVHRGGVALTIPADHASGTGAAQGITPALAVGAGVASATGAVSDAASVIPVPGIGPGPQGRGPHIRPRGHTSTPRPR